MEKQRALSIHIHNTLEPITNVTKMETELNSAIYLIKIALKVLVGK